MAVSFVGTSNLITTNGGVPGAITPHVNTATGDLLLFFHYGRATGGNETVAAPAGQGWTELFQSVTANNGHVAVFWKIRQVGDGTSTFTITNYTSGNSGETILEWIETYRGHDPTTPISHFTATLSTWVTSLTLGSIAAPATATVNDGDMVVVFGGRFENITAQTTLTGDSLTWAQRTLNDSALGLDAGAVTQTGLNSTGSNQTVTAKSITSTGTTGAGAGRMFIIEQKAAITADLTESTSASDAANGSKLIIESVAESVTATDSTSANAVNLVSAIESVSSGDSSSVTAVFLSVVSESSSASELINFDAGQVAIEATTATDNAIAQLSVSRGLTETVSATDSTNRQISTSGSLTENGSAADSTNSQLSTNRGLSEPVTSLDIISAQVLTNGAASEPVTSLDITSAQVLINGAVSESVTPLDSADSILTSAASSITEPVTASDSVSAQISISVVISETTSPSDYVYFLTYIDIEKIYNGFSQLDTNVIYGTHIQNWENEILNGIQAESLEFLKSEIGKVILEEI